MFSRLVNAINPPGFPSAVVVVGNAGSFINILHLIPEDGTFERYGTSRTSTKRFYRAKTQACEQIGTVTIHVGDGDRADSFLDDVETRASELRDSFLASNSPLRTTDMETTRLVQDILQPAALDAIRKREVRERSMNATKTLAVSIFRIRRPTAGKIVPTDFTSFG